MPIRVQLRRTKGWKKPPGVVVVSRPSKWGNPFRETREKNAAAIVALYRRSIVENMFLIGVEDVRRELRGKDLACWCPMFSPCHADVLLEIANS